MNINFWNMNDLKNTSIKLEGSQQLFRISPQLHSTNLAPAQNKFIQMNQLQSPLPYDQVHLSKIYVKNGFQGSVRVFHPEQDIQIDYGIQKEGKI